MRAGLPVVCVAGTTARAFYPSQVVIYSFRARRTPVVGTMPMSNRQGVGCIIVTRNLTKRYGRARGIEQVNLRVPAGDIYGFIGPNGAGKSTLIRTLLGLIRPTKGKAEVLGLPVPGRTREALKRVGYMPSEAAYYPRMRARDVFLMSASLRGLNCERESSRLCDRFDLDQHRRVADLSFGNRKKVAIICALQHKPDLLILDEPTSGLDPLIQRTFWEVLHENNRQGTTIFLSSHVLSEVQQHCRNAAIIREGRLVADDTVENLGVNAPRRITLRGLDSLPETLAGAPGLLNVHTQPGSLVLSWQGEVRPLLLRLQDVPYTDLSIAEPELEDIFLHYYRGGDGA